MIGKNPVFPWKVPSNLGSNISAWIILVKYFYSPVIVHLELEGDDVSLLEAQLTRVLRLEVVQSLTENILVR